MKWIIDILRGVLIGIANIIPGVSGGTMAVSMGIYDKIIYSVTHLFKEFKKSVITLIPYFVGMGIGIVGLAFVIEFLFANYPLPTSMAFIGLIVGGLPILTNKLKGEKKSISNYIVFVLFFALIIGMEYLGKGDSTIVTLKIGVLPGIILVAIGVIAAATMVIPGVSGSMILIILGYYEPIIREVSQFIKALIAFDVPALMHGIGILVPFGIGVILGIFIIAKIIEKLLEKFSSQTYSAILGLVVASPIAILLNTDLSKSGIGMIILAIVTFGAGFLVSFMLGKKEA